MVESCLHFLARPPASSLASTIYTTHYWISPALTTRHVLSYHPLIFSRWIACHQLHLAVVLNHTYIPLDRFVLVRRPYFRRSNGDGL